MGLIINKNINMLMKGFPTVSDKYDVAPAVLTGDSTVEFGDLVQFADATNEGTYFKSAVGAASVSAIAGFVLGTNVKLNETWPEGNVLVNPGEAFNLLAKGFMAIELDSEATATSITANSPVAVILATAKCTTSDKLADTTIVALPNVYFTGTYENRGTTAAPKYYAEIYVK